MIGIIYKFTIKAKYTKDGHKPFYIGQHWCRSVDDFLCRDYPYYGSGEKIKGERNPMKDPEVAKRNAELRKGKKRTPEQCKRISEGRKRINYWWSTNKGNRNIPKKLNKL